MRAFREYMRALAALALIGAAGCFPEGVTNEHQKAVAVAIKVTPVSPATVGNVASPSPSVIVSNKGGKPVPGVPISFSVVAGNGSVTGETQTTDANGVATVGSWVLGNEPGDHKLEARAKGLPAVVFTVKAGAAVPANVTRINDQQSGVVGQPLAAPIGVHVTDSRGNSVAGVTVTFAGANGSSTGAQSVQTGTDGKASTSWTMGTVAGPMTATVTVGSMAPMSFSATAAPGAPAQLTKMNDGQTGTVGTALAQPVGVVVADQYGNKISGGTVTFTPANGSSVSPSSVMTNGQGEATTQWTMGTVAGQMTATATAGSVQASFSATAKAGSPHHVDKVNDNQSANTNTALAMPVGVIVRDAYNNRLSGVAVTFTPKNGTTVSPSSGTTNSTGELYTTWTMGSTAGTVTLDATAGSLAPVTFTATAMSTSTPCDAKGSLSVGATVTGDMSTSGCAYGEYGKIDLWSLNLGGSSAMQLVLDAPGAQYEEEYDTYVAVYRDSYGNVSHQRAYNDDAVAGFTTNSRARFLGGAGTFLVGATHFGSLGGAYTLKAESWNGQIEGCSIVFIVAGSSTTQNLNNDDCRRGTERWSDRVTLYLKAGESVQITMRSTAFDSKIEVDQLVNGYYYLVQSDDNSGGGKDAQLTVAASSNNYYQIHLTSVGANSGGSYTLAVTAATSAGATSARTSSSTGEEAAKLEQARRTGTKTVNP